MPHTRLTPDALLAQVEAEETSRQHGKLKIFFGAAPGVGKTYAMLSEAAEKRANGLDVVIGYIETHRREDIEHLLVNHEILPRLQLDYRGKQFEEFDLELAIKRHPALIIVDEMAHSNIVGVMHSKRWQDILDLLNRGIDVYTSLNVQHIESLNDIIKQITGVTIHERVPDSILELAHSIELVDLPPDDLLKRLDEGKIYFPKQAELASQNFFRKSNLTALRELALRFTAERVNQQVRTERRDRAEQTVWPTCERILVCVDHKPFSIKLIRTARRMAKSLQTAWSAVFVDSPQLHLSAHERNNAIENLRLAEQLGAETAILNGYDMVNEVIAYAHTNNITKIIMGKEIKPRWRSLLARSFTDELVRASKEIDIYIITRRKGASHPLNLPKSAKRTIRWLDYAMSLWTVIACSLLNYILFPMINHIDMMLIDLLGIVFVALRGRLFPTILTLLLNVIVFMNFFSPEGGATSITDAPFLLELLIVILIAEITVRLSIVNKHQTTSLRLQEDRSATFYHLTRELASHRGMNTLLKIGMRHIAEIFNCDLIVLIPTESGHLGAYDIDGTSIEVDAETRNMAQWAYDIGQSAGLGTTTLPSTSGLYYPLQGTTGKIAVLHIQPQQPENFVAPEQLHLLETIIRQVTLAIEVDRLQTRFTPAHPVFTHALPQSEKAL